MSLRDGAIREFVTRCLAHEAASANLEFHRVDFLPAGPVLVVTFEPASTGKMDVDLGRPAWGQGLIARRGHSQLGVKRSTNDWYRAADLHRVMRELQSAMFFARFAKVVFYGPSMGGYAALTFADCAPGCTVLAMHPQSCLAPDRIWFDQRFAGRRAQLWTGDFVDGADGAASAVRVYVCYDPWQIKDRLHAQRLPAHNRVDLRLPFGGHATAQLLMSVGKLGEVFDRAVAGSLDAASFKVIARSRAQSPDYLSNLAARGVCRPRRLRLLARALSVDPSHRGAHALLLQLNSGTAEADTTRNVGMRAGGRRKPRRWPPGLVTAARVPLLYVQIPGVCGTTVQDHLQFLASGCYPDRLSESSQDHCLLYSCTDNDDVHEAIGRNIDNRALVFAFVRDPAERLLMCFTETCVGSGPELASTRERLSRDWGLDFPAVGEPLILPAFRQNFDRFVRFVEADLSDYSTGSLGPPWAPQSSLISAYRESLDIDVIGCQENFEGDMAQILHRAKVRRAPDVRLQMHPCAAPPFALTSVVSFPLRRRIAGIYRVDYAKFQFRRTHQKSANLISAA